MNQLNNCQTKTFSWKAVKSAAEACEAIDVGLMLQWKDMRAVKASLSYDDQLNVMRHLATRFCERVDIRLSGEILTETLLVWLAFSLDEKLIHAFLEQLFQEPALPEAVRLLVEITLTTEVSETEHLDEIFNMSVALCCYLGFYLYEFNKAYPDDLKGVDILMDHIATFLFSVSNTNQYGIRFSLVHYFGYLERGAAHKKYFNRLMARFGFTALEQLFYLLFQKKSEAVAMEYLFENMPYILEADSSIQQMVHETFRTYLLREPDRFALFVQLFSKHLLEKEPEYDKTLAAKTFLGHLAGLLKVVSYVNHKRLARCLMSTLMMFKELPSCSDWISQLLEDKEVRKTFREILRQLQQSNAAEDVLDASLLLRSTKRGRGLVLNRSEGLGILEQVTFLGKFEAVPRTS